MAQLAGYDESVAWREEGGGVRWARGAPGSGTMGGAVPGAGLPPPPVAESRVVREELPPGVK